MIPDETLLEIRNLSVNFSRWGNAVTALNRISFSVPNGQWIMLVGHNGSGKTTLLKSISGVIRSDEGAVFINGHAINRLSARQVSEKVFHVHQDPLMGTAPYLTVFENLLVADFRAKEQKIPRKHLFERYRELVRPLGLSNRMKQLAQYLSGGERQLLALMIARLRPSQIMLLDEPLMALDPEKEELCIREIKELSNQGKTIIQVTHDERLAIELGDRTLILQEGELVYDETKNKRKINDIIQHWQIKKGYDANAPKPL